MAEAKGAGAHTVQVVSVPRTVPLVVLFLGGYSGLLVHWVNGSPGRYEYCPGEETCPAQRHKLRPVWKGYAPVDVWIRSHNHWLPGVLEITESLEHQLSSRVLRGEVWVLKRGGVRKSKEVSGQFTERKESAQIRPTFAVEPVLKCLYHVQDLELGVENPIPPRTMLEAFLGAPPEILFPSPEETEKSEKPSQEQRQTLREMLRNSGHLGANGGVK